MLAVLAVAGIAPAETLRTGDSGSLVIRCGALIDGVSESKRGPANIVIKDGRIVEVAASAAATPGVQQLDLSGYTCLPGLIDMHTHLTMRPDESADLSE